MSQLQVTGEAKIRDIQGPVVANSGVVTALDGAASQYVRGDGTLADFPTSSGGGSSVSYYLNSSVSQGTIGGVAYRELSKDPIIGTGTDIAISSNGYVANYITDVNDPDVTIVPGGNFNCEFYFSVNNNTGSPTTYAELYKYDGTTFTLLGSSVGVPEFITQGTTIAPYYFAIPVPTSALALTDRLAIRIYVNVDGRTVTLHTENGHLCQVVTTFSKGMVSLNNLTDQSQNLTTGTSGSNFAIVSSGDTHTFNLPVASAANTGKLSSTDWSTFNNKQAALSFTAPLDNTANTISIPAATSLVDGYLDNLDWVKFNTAYNDSIISAAVTGTTTKTLTLNQQDGGTVTASWTDDNTDAVSSVFGRTGAVIAVSGDYNTSQVTENTNLYFTDARSRAALSFAAGSGTYNSTTGVITIPTNTNQLTNGASFITLTSLSGGTGITYNNTTGVITNSAPDQTVSLANGAGISVTGTYPSFTIASTITQYTDALARAALSFVAGSGAYNSTTGVITIPTNNNQITNGAGYITSSALSAYLPLTGGILTGFTKLNVDNSYFALNRSATDKFVGLLYQTNNTSQWFVGLRETSTNNYIIFNEVTVEDALTINRTSNNVTILRNITAANLSGTNTGDQTLAGLGGVGGTGTINTIPKFTAASTIASSNIYVNGSFVGINNTTPSSPYALDIHAANSTYNLRLFQPATDTASYNTIYITGNNTTAAAYFGIGGATTGNTSFRDVAVIGTQSAHDLVFNTSDAKKMTLFTTGNLLIGTSATDSGFKLEVYGTSRFLNQLNIRYDSAILNLRNNLNTSFCNLQLANDASANLGGLALFGSTYVSSAQYRQNGTYVYSGGAGGLTLHAEGAYSLFLATNGTTALTINSSQVATFTSGVNATQFISNITNGYGLVLNRATVTNYNGMSLQTAGVAQWFLGMRENLSLNNYIIYNENGTDAFSIAKSNSNVGIGLANAICTFQVRGNNGDTPSSLVRLRDTNSTARTTRLQFEDYNGTIADGLIDFVIPTAGSGTGARLSLGVNGTLLHLVNGGTVLIGTTSGVSGGGALQVNGNVNINGVFQINGTTIGGGGGSGVTGSGTTNYIPKWSGSTSLGDSAMLQDSGGIQYFGGSSSTGNATAAPKYFRFNNDYSTGYTDASLKIYLFNEGGTRQGLTSGPAYDMQYHSSGSDSGRHAFYVGNAEIIRFNKTTVLIGTQTDAGYKLYVNGTIGSTGGFFDTSDKRLKTLITDNHISKGIENVIAKLYIKNGKEELGYYAQDLQDILPSSVNEGNDGFLSLSYSQVHTAKIAYLENEIKELKELIKTLL